MPAGRPKQYSRLSVINVSLDGKDLDFLDDHRGDIPRGKFLIHCMYASRNEVGKIEIDFKKRIEELEQENRSLKAIKGTQGIQTTLDDWWQDKKDSINNYLDKNQMPNWETLFLGAIRNYPGIGWNSSKDVEKYVMERIKFDSENS